MQIIDMAGSKFYVKDIAHPTTYEWKRAITSLCSKYRDKPTSPYVKIDIARLAGMAYYIEELEKKLKEK